MNQTDRDALIERANSAIAYCQGRGRSPWPLIDQNDLRALISLASPSEPEIEDGDYADEWSATGCPRCGSPDPKKHPAVQWGGEVQPCPDPWHTPSLASPSPAQAEREAIRPELMEALRERGGRGKFVRPSPAQWPEDVVLTACKAFLSGPTDMCAETEEGEIFGAMRAALATLPPPEDERVKDLLSAFAAIVDCRAGVIPMSDGALLECAKGIARSAPASYRGGE